MVDETKMKPPNKWVPTTDLVELALLSKAAEETNEMGIALMRCIMQGPNGKDPDTGRPNLEALEDEVADVRGLSRLLVWHFNLDEDRIAARADTKAAHKRAWFRLLKDDGL